jgi:hypothetical protein
MTAEPLTPAPVNQESEKAKRGCGCFLWTCLTSLILVGLVVMVSGVGIWYGIKKLYVPDSVVVWTYQHVVRPEVLKNLPANVSPQQREQILLVMDKGMEKYLLLPPEEKKPLLQEAILAAYYFSEHRVIPPEKIPHLSKFVKDLLDSLPKNEKPIPEALGP